MMKLNVKQQQVVDQTNGPLMVLAGAGSGKTRTIVARIVNMITNLGISPYKILALTFSNKAAKEMRDRVSLDIPNNINTLQITTFHSFCARLLRNEAKYLGLTKNFTIYDDGESRVLIKNIMSRFGVSAKEISPYAILDYINKNKNGSFQEEKDDQNTNSEIDIDFFKQVFVEYEKELIKSNAVDFGGLIRLNLDLFEKFPEVLKRYQQRYEFILVDEYQDTNHAQFSLIRFLSKLNNNICVVGDEDQSIYSWRGADINNILNFEKIFEGSTLIKLEQNYRSSKNIIEAASRVIENNNDRKGKKLWTENAKGKNIFVAELMSDKDESKFICTEIQKIYQTEKSLNEIAVFYRTNAQSRLIEDQLRRQNITYKIIGSVRFYDRKEIKDIVAYLRVLVNRVDSLALSRIINTPTRGIGAVSLKKIEAYALENNLSLYDVFEKIALDDGDDIHIRITKKMLAEIKGFISLIEETKLLVEQNADLHKIYENILFNSGYYAWLNSQKTVESKMRLENLDELSNAIKQFTLENKDNLKDGSLDKFLESITLNETDVHAEDNIGFVSLMTIHGAKGLEFYHVFLSGLEENIFPSYRSIEEDSLEEERRLYYVAMTRAMKTLTITYAQARLQFGQLQFNPPSRFIEELPKEFCKFNKKNITKNSNNEFEHEFKNDFEEDYDEENYYSQENNIREIEQCISVEGPASIYKKNLKIHHDLYGDGIIVDVFGNIGEEKINIKFIDGTVKKFMAKFAPISIVEN